MKVLIWGGVLFITGCITAALGMNGIKLGAIPTIILYLIAYWAGKALCAKYDEKRSNKKDDTDYSDDDRMK